MQTRTEREKGREIQCPSGICIYQMKIDCNVNWLCDGK